MKIINKLTAIVFIAVVSGAACQQAATDTNIAVNTTTANTTAANTANTAAAPAPATADPGSPTAAYHAAYTARKNKDIAGLKALMSKDIIEFFELVGKEEKKSVDDMLRELADRPQAATSEARNEKINGDKATIEYLDEDGKWRPMDFVKEDGKWKLTLAVGDPESEPPAASSNSNK